MSLGFRYRERRLYVMGWLNYFALSEYYRSIPELDEWLRRRLRCCYWKQWRWPRTKISHLVSLGVSLNEAIKTGVSSKGPYAMSRTPITQMAMTNKWLTAQGLVSIKDQWVRLHYPVSTAWFGPACQVVWGGPERCRPLPDYVFYCNSLQFPYAYSRSFTHLISF